MKVIKMLILIFLWCINILFSQINYFNFWRSGGVVESCPVNVYGLTVDINFFLKNENIAKLEIPVSLYWGIVDNLEVGLKVSGTSVNYRDRIDRGMSDIYLAGRYNFLIENRSVPSMSTELCLVIPSGEYRKDIRLGTSGLVLSFLLGKKFFLKTGSIIDTFFNLGYKINGESNNRDIGDNIFFCLEGNVKLTENFVSIIGVRNIYNSGDKIDGKKIEDSEFTESYLFLGIKYKLSEYQQFFSSLSFGLEERSDILVFNIGMMY